MTKAESLKFLSLEQCLDMATGYLVTINMQHVYEARQSSLAASAIFNNPGAKHCLDGRGASKLFRRVCSSPAPLVQGNALLDRWLQEAAGKHLLVIGSSRDIVGKALERFPDVEVSVDERYIAIGSSADATAVAAKLASDHPGRWDLVAIALGVPKQELLACALQEHLIAPIYCIGGSFEILAGVLPRSPKLIQAIGLEGVWRLLLEPSSKRIARLFRSYLSFFLLRLKRPSFSALTGA